MEHVDVNANQKVVMITSKYNTSGKITIPRSNYEESFTVEANQVKIINLPAYTEILITEQITELAIRVETTLPASVYIHQYSSRRSEASLVLPANVLGKEYYTMSYYGYVSEGRDYTSQFLLIGIEDETKISIKLNADTRLGRSKGQSINVTLDKGETYMVQSKYAREDLTGSHISSDKPIAVFSGNSWTEVPSNCGTYDNLIEQMYPVNTWGRQFVTVPTAKTRFDVFRVLASEDQTIVDIGDREITLNKGEYHEYQASEAEYIRGNKPITVAQYLVGSRCSGHSIGDPSMLLLNTIEQTRDTVTLFNSSLQNIRENYINLILKTSDIPLTTVDEKPLSDLGGEIHSIVGTEFSYAILTVTNGAHTIINSGCGVIAIAYGYGEAESYAYGGGSNFRPINASPEIEGGCLNESIVFDSGLDSNRFEVKWDFGDGSGSDIHISYHTYPILGTFNIGMYIKDLCLNTEETVRKNIEITLRRDLTGSPDIEICEGHPLVLEAFDLSDVVYFWTSPNQEVTEGKIFTIDSTSPNQSGYYTVVGSLFGCETYPDSAFVRIFESPKPNLGMDSTFCPGDPQLELTPGAFASYSWSDGSKMPAIYIDHPDTYKVTVTNQFDCAGEDERFFTEYCPTKVYLPNIFSPNGDNLNDAFVVTGVNLSWYEIKIFDRWGNLISVGTSWDGSVNGNPANPGVYSYIIDFDEYAIDQKLRKISKTGTVTLIR